MAQITIEQAIEIALGHHQAGRLAEAEGLYRQILAQFPNHTGTLHLLGVLACQAGHLDTAIELISQAIAIEPAVAEFHANLGESCRRAGRLEEAIVSLRRAIDLKSDLAAAHHNLGHAMKAMGQCDEALAAYRRAIEITPEDDEICISIGRAFYECGRCGEAIAAYNHAVRIMPENPFVHNELGGLLLDQGRLDEALASFATAIRIMPDYAAGHNNLGMALNANGRLDEALASFRRAIELEPGLAEAYNNLGRALAAKGQLDDALLAFRRAIELRPGLAEAHNNLGMVLSDQCRLDEAFAAHDRAIELNPNLAEAHNNLGGVLRDQGRLDMALECFRKAAALKPDFGLAMNNFLLTLHYHPDYSAREVLDEHRRWARSHADPLAGQIGPHVNDASPDRKLRIGFLAPALHEHPVGPMLLLLFASRDRQQTEMVYYSELRSVDEFTRRLEALAVPWHTTVGLNDEQLAARVRDDRIDILVDLALHTAGNRMLVFSRKPAPVQVTMLGMPATTGLSAMDYRLTDPYLDPPGECDGDYSEQSIRLRHCYWCYQPPDESPQVCELPALSNGFVTFGCLNDFAKVNRPVLELWADILHSLPAARLVIQSHPGSHRGSAYALFRDRGIANDRVEFVARTPRLPYLRRYLDLDLSLDPFPYNGHTSTLDALWMGVPVITLAGRTAVGRGGVSILSNLGLPELIAQTPEQFIAIAVGLAGNLDRLADLRSGLRPRIQSSPLMDGKQYTADVESAFRWMWKNWCTR